MPSPSLKDIRTKIETLEKEIRLQRSLLEVIQDPFFILDGKGNFLKVNPKGTELLGYPFEILRQKVFMEVIPLEDLTRVLEGFGEMERGKEIRFRSHVHSRLRGRIPVEFFGTFRDGVFFITLRDLGEMIQMEEELERAKKVFSEKIRERDRYAKELQVVRDLYQEKLKEIEIMKEEAVRLSYTDDLTGIYNHRFFIEQLTLEVERQRRYSTPLSLLMIDIDYFKHYNDTNGHLAGDQVLKAIAVLIQRGVRQSDIVARYGGEEFSAILINAGREKALEIAERVRRNVAETRFPNESAQPNQDLTVSVGVATFYAPLTTLTDLIREADHALYRAKKNGRNRIEG
ncbi:MAG: diguanylate cyclase [Syntrophaceae bacterium]|nr:diguanylate cyclase [Syntrophaceae bacterium]